MNERASHWDEVYRRRGAHELSWYQDRPDVSLRLIAQLGVRPGDRVIDVGGGASTLVDHLLDLGYERLTVLDIAASALAAAQARLGARAAAVRWLTGDITTFVPQDAFHLWHDRAVFHFLVEAADRRAYLRAMSAALAPGGLAIIATFADDGPERCSNLPVRRYSPEGLAAELGAGYTLIDSLRETHSTPGRATQAFIYCCFRRC